MTLGKPLQRPNRGFGFKLLIKSQHSVDDKDSQDNNPVFGVIHRKT